MDFEQVKSGSSVENVRIEAFKSEGKHQKYIYLMAGVHGDEVEGVYVLRNLFAWLEKNDELELPVLIIPVLNVDGYRVSTRGNGHGVDLNRNLPSKNWSGEFKKAKYNPGERPLSEPENAYFVKLMEKYRPGIIISIHSWKPMINYNGDCKDAAELMSKNNDYPVVDSVGYETPGSLGEFAPEKHESPVITYELPRLTDDLGLKEIWAQNEAALIELLESDLIKRFL